MKIAVIAGEASGDLLAAELMAALKQLAPDVQFIGMGGPKMQAQGLDSWYDYKALSLFGLVEVLKHLPALFRLRKNLFNRLVNEQPNVVIGIDAPDFNLGLEKKCKQAGLRTVHFVSPSIWAWRQGRAKKMAQSCDLMLCLFPMEPPIFAKYGVPALFVGHPLADTIPLTLDRQSVKAQLDLAGHQALALLPGSRLSEIKRLLPTFLAATGLLQNKCKELRVLIPAANMQCRNAIEQHLQLQHVANVHILDGDAQTAMIASDAVLLASGTATLEAMLCKRPMVVAYKVSPISLFIARLFRMIKIKSFSLPNVLAGQDLVPELMQERCTPENISDALQHILEHPAEAEKLQDRFLEIHLELKRNAAQQAALAVIELIHAKVR